MFKVELTDEQLMLQDIASRYLADEYGFLGRARAIAAGVDDDARWSAFAKMGWLGLPFPEAYGGGGGDALDLMVLMSAFGKRLVIEPYLATVVLGGLTVLASGTEAQKRLILPRLIEGRLKLAFAFAEPQSGYDPYDILTQAEPASNGFLLRGHKAVVLGAPSVDYFVISARTAGGQRDRNGISLFLVDARQQGITLQSYQTLDGRRAAEVRLDGIHVGVESLLGARDGGAPALDEALLRGSVAILGEASGCLDGAVSETVAHLKTREQFGKKLSSFQALQHALADVYVLAEEAKALAFLAAQTMVKSTGADRFEAMSAAKAYMGDSGRRVCEKAVQLHGAIAITDEHIVGHYLKRMIVIDRLFGGTDHHMQKFLATRPWAI